MQIFQSKDLRKSIISRANNVRRKVIENDRSRLIAEGYQDLKSQTSE